MTRAELTSTPVVASAHRLISELWPLFGAGAEMHVGDLYWALFHRRLPDPAAAVGLWRADGVLQALTVFPGRTWCDVVFRPEHASSSLSEAIIDWAIRECRRKNPQPTEPLVLRIGRRVFSPERLAFLERLGFAPMNTGYLALRVDAPAPRQHRELPAGFVCRPLQPGDIPSRIAAYNLAFPGEDLSLDDYLGLRSCAGYDPSLDLVVVTASGAIASFCTLWLDEANRVGLLEPVGCHPAYRRRGLTQFAIQEGLEHLWARGAKQAIVRVQSENLAARSLYFSCGFSIACMAYGHEKRIG